MCKLKFKNISLVSLISDFLKMISIGKHNHGLYFDGKRMYSTLVGGLFTVVILFLTSIFAFSTLRDIFTKDQYVISYNLRSPGGIQFEDEFKLYDLDKAFNKMIIVNLDSKYHQSCAEIEMIVKIKYENNKDVYGY